MRKPNPERLDHDLPDLGDAFFARARPASEVMGEAFIARARRPGPHSRSPTVDVAIGLHGEKPPRRR